MGVAGTEDQGDGSPPAALFAGIVELSVDAAIALDEHQRIILFNRGAEAIFGYDSDEVVGRSHELLVPERFRSVHNTHIAAFGEGSETARQMGHRGEIRGLRKNGEEFPAEASIAKLEVDGRRVYSVVLRDVTEQKEYERSLERTATELTRMNRDLEAVLSMVSHDLGNPLAAVVMVVERMLDRIDEKGDPRVRNHLEMIQESAQSMTRLVEDLLEVGRSEAGHLTVRRRVQAIGPLVERAIRQIREKAERQGMTLEADLPTRALYGEVDEVRLAQVLGNLLSNAVKFAPLGGRIRVKVGDSESEVTISVIDSGPGIDPEDLPHLFDRFWQARRHRRGGAGLGLAIAREIVMAHGGRIWAEARRGGGSSFSFTLPLKEPE